MDFNTKGHEVEEKSEYVSSYIKPGIHTAKITSVKYYEPSSGTPGIEIIHETKPVEGLEGKGQVAITRWWMSTKAWPYTMDNLVIMADKLGVREALDALDTKDPVEYANTLNGIFMGKAARWKFSGEEIKGGEAEDGTQKQNWFKAQLARYSFIEPLSVPEEESKLSFKETNKYDMKRLAPADVPASVDNGGSSDTDDQEAPWA